MKTFASADEMKTEAVSVLTQKLNGETVDEDILDADVENAINEIEAIRCYPASYTDTMIWKDMSRYFNNVLDVALYDYNQTGIEGETAHTENGVSRSYKSRNSCFYGVRPFSVVI